MSCILKVGEDQYLRVATTRAKAGERMVHSDVDTFTKHPDLASEFATPEQARAYADGFEGGKAWEVWAYRVVLALIPGA